MSFAANNVEYQFNVLLSCEVNAVHQHAARNTNRFLVFWLRFLYSDGIFKHRQCSVDLHGGSSTAVVARESVM